MQFRNANNHISDELQREKIENIYPIEILNYKITNQTKLTSPILRTLQFSSNDLVDKTPNKIYLDPLLFLTKRTNPFKKEDRNFPVEYTTPFKEINKLSIYIPAEYTIESIPKPMGISSSNGKYIYKFQATKVNSKISIMSSLEINGSSIPSTYYKEIKNLYKQMIAKQAEKIVLVKK